jgi:pimeloyl-ACP methyl ester carboxylesterase
MKRFVVVALALITLVMVGLLPSSTAGAATGWGPVAIQRVLTRDANGTEKTRFQQGEAIQYAFLVNNTSGQAQTADVLFWAFKPAPPGSDVSEIEIYRYETTVSIPPGVSGWYSPSTIPQDGPNSDYYHLQIRIAAPDLGLFSSIDDLYFSVGPPGSTTTTTTPTTPTTTPTTTTTTTPATTTATTTTPTTPGGNCMVDDGTYKIEPSGNALTASNVAIIVPGIAQDYGNFDKWLRPSAENLYREIQQWQKPPPWGTDKSAAVIAWLGYTTPPALPQGLLEAGTSGDADVGAKNLNTFIACLRAMRHAHNFSLTVIGHSYGSVVVGRAAAHGWLNGDNVVFVGSPGVDAPKVASLGHPRAVYAGENPNDVIQLATQPVVQGLLNAAELGLGFTPTLVYDALKQAFGPDSDIWRIGHGFDPTSTSFGARRFSTNGECGHEYFKTNNHTNGPEGLQNLARITMGKGASVSPERRAPISPFTIKLSYNSLGPIPLPQRPEVTGLSFNWTPTCHDPSQANAGKLPVDLANHDVLKDLSSLAGIVSSSIRNLLQRPVNLMITASHPETVTVQVYATALPARRATAASKQRVIVIAAGRQTVTHAGRFHLQLHLTAAGRRYLLGQHRPGSHKTLRLALAVLVQLRGHRGYFARPITARF